MIEKTREALRSRRRIPAATYRIQLSEKFRFADAERLVSYLREIGISHLYPSPLLRARPGSKHGYDISNHSELNPELGGSEEYARLVESLRHAGMGQLFDMVPNHMGILGNENTWWLDILENGPSSLYARYFDIDWYSALKPELHERVLLPILGSSYGEALESGELQLHYEGGAFTVRYFEHSFPIAPCSLEPLLQRGAEWIADNVPAGSGCLLEYQSILTGVKNLPKRNETRPERVEERMREKEVLRRRLETLVDESEPVHDALMRTVAEYNGVRGRADSFDMLDVLLNDQSYRLSYFRVAADEVNYRRFFDINELAALNIERPEVFRDTHSLLLDLLRDGVVDGVRIDHVDGLYDPKNYLLTLQQKFVQNEAGLYGEPNAAEDELRGLARERPLYVVVEKILGTGETLRDDWPVHGTTGYEFLALANALFVNSENEKAFNRIYSYWSSGSPSYAEVVYRSKQLIQSVAMASELHVLAKQLDRISERNRRSRDFTLNALTGALREVISCFPVYRTYGDDSGISEEDRCCIDKAVGLARRRNPGIHPSIFEFVRDTLLLCSPDGASEDLLFAQREFLRKFQQVTSPVTAKGVEDTSFYLYNRFLSLNEVGSDPAVFGISPERFHEAMIERSVKLPHSLSATTTHDTKRGEDTRARLNVLSEIPDEFEKALLHFEELVEPFAVEAEGRRVPDRNTAYLFFQTVIGVWPLRPDPRSREEVKNRIQEYMHKAVHEAKQFTTWISPDERYNSAVRTFVEGALDEQRSGFVSALEELVASISGWGLINSLSQLTLKLCAPGVPDIYQGAELWDFSLVDPDNRRPVDFEKRKSYLSELLARAGSDRPRFLAELLRDKEDGRVKLFTLWSLLQARAESEELFAEGKYVPAEVSGVRSGNILAFTREHKGRRLLVAIPRFLASFTRENGTGALEPRDWGDTVVREDPAAWVNLFTGERLVTALTAADLFRLFPVAVLMAD